MARQSSCKRIRHARGKRLAFSQVSEGEQQVTFRGNPKRDVPFSEVTTTQWKDREQRIQNAKVGQIQAPQGNKGAREGNSGEASSQGKGATEGWIFKKAGRPRKETKVAAFDTEDNTKGEAFLCCLAWWGKTEGSIEKAAFYGKEWRQAFAERIEQEKITLIYAANLEYDLNNVFGVNDDLVRVYVGSRILYAEWFGIEFRDASWYENPPISVARMGQQIGIPKLEMPAGAIATADMVTYCSRDAEIVLRWVRAVQGDFDKLGIALKRTLPSTSLAYFKSVHGIIPNQPEIDVRGKGIIEFLRQGYFGGRTEAFYMRPVRGTIHAADISSMYPFVMSQEEYPSPDTAYFTDHPDIEQPGAYYCNIHAPPIDIPLLPYRHDGLTVFPVGRFSGVWTSPELLTAVERGYDVKPIYGVAYQSCYRPFVETINTLYEWKRNGHTRAKFIMNSLYGKFGESGVLLEVKGNEAKEIQNTPRHANVIWSAYVTAYARIKLIRGLERVQRNGAMVLYCDTDSCFYSSNERILDERNDLGAWVHKDTRNVFHCKAPKLYRFGDEYHSKGIPRNEALQYFIHGMAEYVKPNRFRESIRRGLSLNVWEKRIRTTAFEYRKRIVHSDGTTMPLTLPIAKQSVRRK